jgi:hypothetical protein
MIRTRHVDRDWDGEGCRRVVMSAAPHLPRALYVLCFHKKTSYKYKLLTTAQVHKLSVCKTRDIRVCEIPQHGHRDTAHLRFSFHSYEC